MKIIGLFDPECYIIILLRKAMFEDKKKHFVEENLGF